MAVCGERDGGCAVQEVAKPISRPQVFSAESVRAFLSGEKTQASWKIERLLGNSQYKAITQFQKSQTRGYDWTFRDYGQMWHDLRHEKLLEKCPYGVAGDSLWVKETFWVEDYWTTDKSGELVNRGHDLKDFSSRIEYCATVDEEPRWFFKSKVSALFMPRWVSRITLEIVDVRVELDDEWDWVLDFKVKDRYGEVISSIY